MSIDLDPRDALRQSLLIGEKAFREQDNRVSEEFLAQINLVTVVCEGCEQPCGKDWVFHLTQDLTKMHFVHTYCFKDKAVCPVDDCGTERANFIQIKDQASKEHRLPFPTYATMPTSPQATDNPIPPKKTCCACSKCTITSIAFNNIGVIAIIFSMWRSGSISFHF